MSNEKNTLITELTPAQEQERVKFHKKYFNIGTCTKPADFTSAEQAISAMYVLIGKKAPHFIHAKSPYDAQIIINDNTKKTNDKLEYYGTSLWGQQDAYWISFYMFVQTHLKKDVYKEEDLAKLLLWNKIALSCGWWYPFENVCIICDRPEVVKMKNERLHCENGPAVRFRDGFEIYKLNNVTVPKELVTTPWDKIDVKKWIGNPNAEIRREVIRKVGIEKIMSDVGGKLLDKVTNIIGGPYELYAIKLGGETTSNVLKMLNPSIGVYHMEFVPPECTTVRQALKFRNGTDELPSKIT